MFITVCVLQLNSVLAQMATIYSTGRVCLTENDCRPLDPGKYPIDNNNNEILIKREPLVNTRARRAVQQQQQKKLGQYNGYNKLIHGQYTSRYKIHLSLSLSLSPPSLSDWAQNTN